MKLFYEYMVIFFNLSPTSSHLHPLQVENCGSNSRLVVDEGQLIVGHDMYISLLLVTQCVPNSRRIFVQKLFTPLVTIAYCIILPMLVQSVYTLTILYFECNMHSFLNPIWNTFLDMVVLKPHYTLNINGCLVK